MKDESTFHPLAMDSSEGSYPDPTNGKSVIANTSDEKKRMVVKNTIEAPCHESDGRPMDADSFHHRGGK